MTIRYTRRFKKQFQALKKNEQKRFWERLELFIQNPDHAQLRRHVLKGKYTGLYSINIGGDIRAVYIEMDDELILFKLIGTHSKLYR
ncbi:MAG: type II toxin-antitoxin system mRNA interferase toxin, RelE/StbE family [Candidatus Saccharibacteria bacterium]|nr:type II toxin-antitoxin system mRNA interferase toxin, RelE/StbE family [Candidatus Saccharibacteria bacterium]